MNFCAFTMCNNETEDFVCNECRTKIDTFTDKCDKAKELMTILDIKENELTVHITILYDIFMSEERMKIINSKLKNKIFW